MIKTAILTMSDTGSRGERIDGTAPALRSELEGKGFIISYYKTLILIYL